MPDSEFIPSTPVVESFKAGESDLFYRPSGLIYADPEQTLTGADTLETDLKTFTLPANVLAKNGDALKITAYGLLGNNANEKTVRLWFGNSFVFSKTSSGNGFNWKLEAIITRNGASAQRAISVSEVGPSFTTAAVVDIVADSPPAPNEDTTQPIIIRITGQNAVASAGDVTSRLLLVEFLSVL